MLVETETSYQERTQKNGIERKKGRKRGRDRKGETIP